MSKPIIDDDGEVRELTAQDFAKFKPMGQMLPALQQQLIDNKNQRRQGRGKQKKPTKEAIYIRLSPDVVDHFRSTGKGWQGRVDEILKDYVANTKPNG